MSPMARTGPVAPHPRRVAVMVWAAMVGFLLAFLAMELALDLPTGSVAAQRRLFFGLAIVTSALCIVLSRLLPPRIPAQQAGGKPAALALVRMVIGWSLCVGAALFAMVAHLLTQDPRLLGVFGVDLLALLTLFPGEDAWTHLSVDAGPRGPDERGGPGRTVR